MRPLRGMKNPARCFSRVDIADLLGRVGLVQQRQAAVRHLDVAAELEAPRAVRRILLEKEIGRPLQNQLALQTGPQRQVEQVGEVGALDRPTRAGRYVDVREDQAVRQQRAADVQVAILRCYRAADRFQADDTSAVDVGQADALARQRINHGDGRELARVGQQALQAALDPRQLDENLRQDIGPNYHLLSDGQRTDQAQCLEEQLPRGPRIDAGALDGAADLDRPDIAEVAHLDNGRAVVGLDCTVDLRLEGIVERQDDPRDQLRVGGADGQGSLDVRHVSLAGSQELPDALGLVRCRWWRRSRRQRGPEDDRRSQANGEQADCAQVLPSASASITRIGSRNGSVQAFIYPQTCPHKCPRRAWAWYTQAGA
jgi:hypothetical protein